MHYNHFTIDYIETIKRNLKIVVNEKGEALYFPDSITDEDIINLRNELQSIWGNSQSAISILQSKHDSTIQSGLFGLVNELETALKIGFLIGDRVVLLDYLFERILLRKEPNKIDRIQLGVIVSSLVAVLPLAQTGRIVIIPTPFNWNAEAKKIMEEVSTRTRLTTELMSMLNMLSITKTCKLHPYTIAESDEYYTSIINNQIDNVDAIGKDGGQYAYEGILGALLSEKLLKETELSFALNVPMEKYYKIISSNKDFYLKYLSLITTGGSLNAQNNIGKLRNDFLKIIKERNKKIPNTVAKVMTVIGSFGSGSISLLGATSVISAPLAITGAALGLSATLTGLVNSKEEKEDIIISVFKKLHSS